MRLKVDGREVEAQEGALLLEVAQVPTLCHHPLSETKGLCRLCLVEVEGRLLPACATRAQEGMEVRTDTPGLRALRKTLLEWLALTTDLSQAPGLRALLERHGGEPGRWGEVPGRQGREALRDNPFFLRDYAKCVNCRRCVDACGDGLMGVWALTLEGRGLLAHPTTPLDRPLPETPCVFCGNCIQVCPTGALRPLALEVG
ncbi:MAG: 2Fe-2S iron-sulfur cluster-binding protein [Thermus sp.]|uniref:2Fe-2S iron-sulfur cluster-binding protein n=1 Tax=Thermus sp. TaxID=275 RepID=UPI002600FF8E|nr:2Fe-2S iron-sulfur cluster-binding protein [Thermus sp.]MCS6868601.1 2Fe-2S iron-sulfur cluster-binding protein [Thermus sp.]MCS7218543.1 2Fe-2S iron-sulfur cluster-binding protein [Thermus sp.]MCX7849971.1 2Fe-2S iron-sulfur cluster-binding protein [Thermus sp.]MDW8017708.1 2Fe-2S iron-sulfur cluster-binding protein [Thermus sp.]MDW8357388.1 2Fe-2S iron-sulfur cluster-binding protein [Thermus sp.]